MPINIDKTQTGMLNKTQYATEMTVSDLKLWKLSCFRLNIKRQKMDFSYHFEFHLEKYEPPTMYTNSKRCIFFQL